MHELKSTLHFKRNWLLGGYSAEYTLSLSIEIGWLSDLVAEFLEKVVPLATTAEKPLSMLDLKGRNPQDLLLPGLVLPGEDELFLFTGDIATDWEGGDFIWSPFTVSGGSTFASFEGAHHITSSLAVHRSPSIPEWLPTLLLGRSIPLLPRFFRFGVEHFRSNFISAALGYAPSVTESFLLDATSDQVMVRVIVDSRSNRDEDCFASVPILGAASNALKRSLGADIGFDFATRLATHLR
jgi:hypothetical protein